MATIQMVNRLNERQGLRLAKSLRDDSEDVSAVLWWAAEDASEPRLLIGFDSYYEQGPLACIERLGAILREMPHGDAPNLMDTECVANNDPRLKALVMHPWTTVPLNVPDLTYRFVGVWSRTSGAAQALVYFLRAGDEVRVPLPPALPQAA